MNQMELTPNYAGTLRGFTNTFGNIQGFVAPLIAGVISNNEVCFLTTFCNQNSPTKLWQLFKEF
jgi:hypothetical protein